MTKTAMPALRKKIVALTQKPDAAPLELAEALTVARALPEPPRGDRPTLAELMQLTGLSRRAICYLVKVGEQFGDLDIPRDRLSKIGWTKLVVIAEVCEPGDELAALDVAEICTVKDLPQVLKGGRKPGRRRTVLLRFTEADYDFFEMTLRKNGAKSPRGRATAKGLVGMERALMRALGRI